MERLPYAPKVQIDQGWLNIDGDAGTPIYRYDGNPAQLDFLKYDVTALGYYVRDRGRAAVIGVGGGRDLMTASVFGFRDITGVEYNPIFVRLFATDYRDFSGAGKVPGLRLVVDDARSWFARSTENFDSIQMSLIDTWAATGAGAFTLSESGLYTVNGWKRFLARLTPRGVFSVSRWFSPEHLNETGRVLALAMASLIEEGGTTQPLTSISWQTEPVHASCRPLRSVCRRPRAARFGGSAPRIRGACSAWKSQRRADHQPHHGGQIDCSAGRTGSAFPPQLLPDMGR